MNKRYFLILGFMFLISLAVFVAAVPSWKTPTCVIEQDNNIVIYGDTGFGGVGSLSKSWITHFMDWWETQDSSINYVFVEDSDIESNCDLSDFPNVKLYVQPGGNAYYQQRSLGSAGKTNIIDFLNNDGGSYLGICAGFYYAAGDYYWQDDYYDWSDLLGIFPTVEGSITDIADYDENPGYAMTSLSNGFEAIYYGGPTRGWKDTPNTLPVGAENVASFANIPGELPAIVKTDNMLLTSTHLEAYENDGISGLSTDQRIENYKLLANLINEVAGTNFYVPQYTNPPEPECNDGLDNDGDGSVDMIDSGCADSSDDDESNCGDLVCEGGETWQTCSEDCAVPQCSDSIDNDGDIFIDFPADIGCSSAEDNDETDPSGPIEILFDGFEDGNLDEWTLYGTGRPWGASTDISYEGSWSAKATYTGAGDDSFIETTIDASGYDSVTFEYYRQLIGLDAADDFEVQYYDGIWYSVEHLGDARASDSSFVFKSYNIPSTATKIRFKCECGAVSEKCYVDNVKVIAQ